MFILISYNNRYFSTFTNINVPMTLTDTHLRISSVTALIFLDRFAQNLLCYGKQHIFCTVTKSVGVKTNGDQMKTNTVHSLKHHIIPNYVS